ncbi:Arm DNA-binding domain-containing protein [Paraburkholderia youngii]|uniref:Arm DNA-binding domain-containing protein n=1 Tax=Paraburkholderia youngii TaxID=2782701 RepID=UPI003D1A3576
MRSRPVTPTMAKTERTPLSDAAVRAAVPLEKIRKLYDSLGLLVEIHPSGGKYWRLNYRFAAREKRLALGVFPDVTVRDARKLRDEAVSCSPPGSIRARYARKSASHSVRKRTGARRRCASCWIATGHCRSGWGNAA